MFSSYSLQSSHVKEHSFVFVDILLLSVTVFTPFFSIISFEFVELFYLFELFESIWLIRPFEFVSWELAIVMHFVLFSANL